MSKAISRPDSRFPCMASSCSSLSAIFYCSHRSARIYRSRSSYALVWSYSPSRFDIVSVALSIWFVIVAICLSFARLSFMSLSTRALSSCRCCSKFSSYLSKAEFRVCSTLFKRSLRSAVCLSKPSIYICFKLISCSAWVLKLCWCCSISYSC